MSGFLDGTPLEGGSVGLVHDYLLVMRGAERTFAEIADCDEEAPIHTLLYDDEGTEGRFDGRDVRTSRLQRLGIRQSGFRRLLPLFPPAARRLPVKEHDVVVSSSSAFAHGVQARKDAIHVCYCHTPFRYAWFERARALAEVPAAVRPLLRRLLNRIRRWDRESADGVTRYVANSQLCRERIQEFWDRDAPVVHPPVDVDRFETADPEDYFLVVTELVPHKRVDMALEAARRAGRQVKVVGSGPDRERLEAGWSDVASFSGRVSDEELNSLYSHSQALIVPNVEEFGIAAVESQAAGRPVVGVNAGGVRETVVDGETGVLVEDRNTDAMAEALRYEQFDRFSPERASRNADRFSNEAFKQRFSAEVRRAAAAA